MSLNVTLWKFVSCYTLIKSLWYLYMFYDYGTQQKFVSQLITARDLLFRERPAPSYRLPTLWSH